MPRKGIVSHREVLPDGIFATQLVTKFINSLMWGGKKSVAEAIFYESMEKIKERSQDDPLKVFKKAVENAKPLMEVKTRRVGGANYQIPVEVGPDRRTSLGIRWLITFARARGEKGMVERLTGELLDAYNNRGSTIKKKEDTHRMAEANRAFAHYRW
ncbi:MAG: 30S ribosomal protein S7 [Acidobacteria bacterium]|nr:30S ribosomal protein S7 [Acidobacteriota bacterium]